ncbi:E3 ubiquitin-protein ligase [Sesbania bispinosa]|nr:E3 ubiquitin-protein ligase [Sesbania bispinosa]
MTDPSCVRALTSRCPICKLVVQERCFLFDLQPILTEVLDLQQSRYRRSLCLHCAVGVASSESLPLRCRHVPL